MFIRFNWRDKVIKYSFCSSNQQIYEWTEPVVQSSEAYYASWGANWLHQDIYSLTVYLQAPKTPAKGWYCAASLLWLVSDIDPSNVGDRKRHGVVFRLEWEDHVWHFWSAARCSFLIIVSHLISDHQFFSSHLLLILCILCQCPLFCTSSSVIFVACSVGDSYSMHSVTTSTLWFSPTLFCALLFLLFPFLCLCLCSPSCFLGIYFHCCQSLLLKAFVAGRPSQLIFPPSCHTVLICRG